MVFEIVLYTNNALMYNITKQRGKTEGSDKMKVRVNDSFWVGVMGDKAEADIRSTGRKTCVKSAKTSRIIKRNLFKDEHQRHFIRENGGFRQIQSDKYGVMEICGPLFEKTIEAATS